VREIGNSPTDWRTAPELTRVGTKSDTARASMHSPQIVDLILHGRNGENVRAKETLLMIRGGP
jgi:hypothetical protein